MLFMEGYLFAGIL